MSLRQFSLCEAYGQKLVILINTLINEVDSILVATVHADTQSDLIKGLQIPVMFDEKHCYVDALGIATIVKKQMTPLSNNDLALYRTDMKSGVDLLIAGF